MAGFSGFTESLKSSIIDVSGDINILKRGGWVENSTELEKEIREISPEVTDVLAFTQTEVLVAHKGKLNAVIMQGIEWEKAAKMPELKKRMISVIKPGDAPELSPIYIGKVVAERLKLNVGDSFKAILPRVSKASATRISPKVENFYVEAILDFGKYDFNERVVVAGLKVVQELTGSGDKIRGFRLRLRDSDLSSDVAERLQEKLGWDYSIRDWTMVNRSLFRAIEYEKMVLFFVMLIMVIAAFFNVSTTLFLGVLRRYSQISVMRALGLKSRDIIVLFCLHGLALGVCGLALGLTLGFLFSWGFEVLQKVYPIMPEEVYRMSNFSVQLQLNDIIWVIVATLVICFLSTLAPAFRGAKLSPVEGLKYE